MTVYPQLSGRQVYVPSTGVAATDTAALQAAHDSFSANGGTIGLDAGPYVLTGGSLNFTKPVHLLGTGPNGPPPTADLFLPIGSVMQCASTTANAITINADGCTLEKLYVQNTAVSSPVSGAGVQVASKGRSTRIVDCTVDGFFIDVDFVSGFYWIVDRCVLTNPVSIGIQIDDALGFDAGDQILSSTLVQPGPRTPNNTGTAIFWKSGGGLRVVNCKVNNNSLAGSGTFQTAYALIVKDGTVTRVFVLANCSLENTQFGVIIQDTGSHTGTIGKIVIANNEFLTSSTAISINPTVGPFDDIDILGNVGTSTMTLANCTNVKLHGPPFATGSRPTPGQMRAGSWYYDTTLHKPGFADGSGNWRDAAGTII